MKIIAIITKEKREGGAFVIRAAGVEAVIRGPSAAEAKTNFEAAVNLSPGDHITYKYDIASVFDNFNFINVSKFAKRAGINAILLRQYKSCNTYISDAQVSKIENALREAGRELSTVSLTLPVDCK